MGGKVERLVGALFGHLSDTLCAEMINVHSAYIERE